MKETLKTLLEGIKVYVDKKVDFDEIEILQETNIIDALSDNNNNILTDNNGKIFVL